MKTKAFGHPESPLARRPSSCPYVVRLHATQQTSSLLLARPPASLWRPARYVIRASCPAWLPLSSCHVSLRVLALLSGWTFSFSVCLCCCCCWLCRGPFFACRRRRKKRRRQNQKAVAKTANASLILNFHLRLFVSTTTTTTTPPTTTPHAAATAATAAARSFPFAPPAR